MTSGEPPENPDSENRRQFSRIEFDAQTFLKSDGESLPVQLVDVSLRGALIALPAELQEAFADGAHHKVTLEILLAGHAQEIRMECEVAHREADHLGLKCLHIDLDSVSHLRRLVELNLGDSTLLDRELASLV